MTARLAAMLNPTAALIYRRGRMVALQNARKPSRTTLTCKYSPDCFHCPLADCAVEPEKAEATNPI